MDDIDAASDPTGIVGKCEFGTRQLAVYLRTRLGRLIRDIRRKTEGDDGLRETFAGPLSKAMQIGRQRQQQRGWKFYSWHAPEVECIGYNLRLILNWLWALLRKILGAILAALSQPLLANPAC